MDRPVSDGLWAIGRLLHVTAPKFERKSPAHQACGWGALFDDNDMGGPAHEPRITSSVGALTPTKNGIKTTSTMDSIRINLAEGTPLYQQVAAEIRRAITDGEAKPGERMPLAKDLATVLGVNANTVLRALRELRRRNARISARSRHHRCGFSRAGCRDDTSEGLGRVRTTAGLPT